MQSAIPGHFLHYPAVIRLVSILLVNKERHRNQFFYAYRGQLWERF